MCRDPLSLSLSLSFFLCLLLSVDVCSTSVRFDTRAGNRPIYRRTSRGWQIQVEREVESKLRELSPVCNRSNFSIKFLPLRKNEQTLLRFCCCVIEFMTFWSSGKVIKVHRRVKSVEALQSRLGVSRTGNVCVWNFLEESSRSDR